MDCGSSQACILLVNYVAPSLGLVCAQALFFSPFPDVLLASKRGSLRNINPMTYAVMVFSQFGGVLYGLLVEDYFIYLTNISGIILALTFVLMTIPLASKRLQIRMIITIVIGMGLVLIGSFLSFLVLPSLGDRIAAYKLYPLGSLTILLQIVFYATPVSQLMNVIRKRNSNIFRYPFVITSIVNCAFWLVYGLVKLDIVIALPNALCLLMSIIQLIARMVYPASDDDTMDDGNCIVRLDSISKHHSKAALEEASSEEFRV